MPRAERKFRKVPTKLKLNCTEQAVIFDVLFVKIINQIYICLVVKIVKNWIIIRRMRTKIVNTTILT